MRSLLIVSLLSATAVSSGAQQADPNLRPFDFLVGSCWTGTFPDGKQTDEHCFERMLDGKFVRDRHVVRGGAPYAGESIYSWDAPAKQITFMYYSSAGFVMKGAAVASGDSIVFPSRLTTAQGEMDIRSVWTRRGADAYHVTDRQRTAEGWKTTKEMDFRRTK